MGKPPSFDYHPPKMARQEKSTSYPSYLDPSVIQINYEKVYSNLKDFKKLAKKEVLRLDLTLMKEEILKYVLKSEYVSLLQGVPDAIISFIKNKKFNET